MVSRGEDKYVIWPVYFDKSLSKLEGRKVPKKNAVDKPSIEDIAKAAKSLGLNPVLEKNVAHPSRHWKKEGRVLIDKKDSKSKLLKQIANRLN
jgi:signal recognition particle subunit SRP19